VDNSIILQKANLDFLTGNLNFSKRGKGNISQTMATLSRPITSQNTSMFVKTSLPTSVEPSTPLEEMQEKVKVQVIESLATL
jgi:hypothetical protein